MISPPPEWRGILGRSGGYFCGVSVNRLVP